MRYNRYTIKLTLLKCTIRWVVTKCNSCKKHHHKQDIKHFHPSRHLQPLGNHWSICEAPSNLVLSLFSTLFWGGDRKAQAPSRWLCCPAQTSSSLLRDLGESLPELQDFGRSNQTWGTNKKAESSFLTHMPAFSHNSPTVLKPSFILSWP